MRKPRTIFDFGSALLASLLMLVALEGRLHAANVRQPASRLSAAPVELADRIKDRAAVTVRIDGMNVKMVSVALLPGDAYVVSIDDSFLNSPTEDDADADITHKLGHAWIYSHHSFLQSEEHSNEAAMPIAGRETLKRLHRKMSTQTGIVANFDEILPPICKPSN